VWLFGSMFILLRGQVSVYDDGSSTAGDGDGSDEHQGAAAAISNVTTKTGDEFRQQLGAFVVTLNGE